MRIEKLRLHSEIWDIWPLYSKTITIGLFSTFQFLSKCNWHRTCRMSWRSNTFHAWLVTALNEIGASAKQKIKLV